MLASSDFAVESLLNWCSTHGIKIDARIRVARGEGGGIGVYSLESFIEPNTTLVTIPKSAVLSIRNCSATEYIPKVIFGKEAQLGLSLGLYGEMLAGESSPWFGYLQSLPTSNDLALLWDADNEDEASALYWTKGTVVEYEIRNSTPIENKQSDQELKSSAVQVLRQYYESTVVPAIARVYSEESPTLEGFVLAYALVSSRAFIVDAYHGLAMVPIADAFNHEVENHIHLESNHDVCPVCGSFAMCEHDVDDVGPVQKKVPEPAGERNGDEDEDEDTCDMVTNAPIPPLTQVFNTYGENLSNAQLLVRYGFLLDGNENDHIFWDSNQLRITAGSYVDISCIHRSYGNARGEKIIDATSSDNRDSEIKTLIKHSSESAERAAKFYTASHLHTVEESFSSIRNVADMGSEDQHLKIIPGQVLLDRVQAVLERWCCGGDTWTSSNLVYDPRDLEREEHVKAPEVNSLPIKLDPSKNRFFPSEEYNNRSSASFSPQENQSKIYHQQKKRDTLSFRLNDEARISHHLWIFCTLLVLHMGCLQCRIDSVSSDSTPMGKEWKRTAERHLEVAEPVLSTESQDTSAHGEDNIFKEGVKKAQVSHHRKDNDQGLETLQLDEQHLPDVLISTFDEEVRLLQDIALVQSHLENILAAKELEDTGIDDTMELGDEMTRNFLPREDSLISVTKQTLIQSAVTKESLSGTIEEKQDRTRKRHRSSSSESRPLKKHNILSGHSTELTSVNSIRETDAENPSRRLPDVGCHQKSALSVLLQYSEDSDIEQIDSDIEAQSPADVSTVSTTTTTTQIRPDGVDLADIASDGADHRLISTPAEPNEDSAKDIVGEGPETNHLRYKLLREIVASTARVVSELCAARIRGMAFSDLDLTSLGDVVDAIPVENKKTRMAAQLALSERACLESCISTWNEIEKVARRF